ncbi:hypothetical protein [Pinibacter soli]|uniref:HTH cro/C1-type domain-containing protein n=1 Tax=Pinibacter soli TaxID=3044211 RepID=A0ABT6RBL4_9BACT|nr:hypothetical protein [Pinibacter soli]MDI3319962.1 hypothetical protein [Pinibacter soli]
MSKAYSDMSQIEKFSHELQQLKVDITPKDRTEAMAELGIKSNSTISKYLNGKLADLDTASSLLAFFKRKIKDRNKILNA